MTDMKVAHFPPKQGWDFKSMSRYRAKARSRNTLVYESKKQTLNE